MSRFLIALLVVLFSLLQGCHEPMIHYFENHPEHKNCKVMKLKNLPNDYVEATLRCGVLIKVEKVRRSTRSGT